MPAINLSARPTASQRAFVFTALGKDAQKALDAAVRRTTQSGAAEIRRVFGRETNLSSKYRQRAITTKFSKTPTGLEGIIIVSGRQLPLIAYGGRINKRGGLSVSPDKTKAPIVETKNVFKAKMKGPLPDGTVSPGHIGYFRRRFVNGKPAPRLPVVEMFGPSAAVLLAAFGRDDQIQAFIDKAMGKNIRSQINRFTSPVAAKRA